MDWTDQPRPLKRRLDQHPLTRLVNLQISPAAQPLPKGLPIRHLLNQSTLAQPADLLSGPTELTGLLATLRPTRLTAHTSARAA